MATLWADVLDDVWKVNVGEELKTEVERVWIGCGYAGGGKAGCLRDGFWTHRERGLGIDEGEACFICRNQQKSERTSAGGVRAIREKGGVGRGRAVSRNLKAECACFASILQTA